MNGLLTIDVQRDFVTGSLAVPGAVVVTEQCARNIREFRLRGWPTFFSGDLHPSDHCSFRERGGVHPAHCVEDTPGAEIVVDGWSAFRNDTVWKGREKNKEAYSAFEGTRLREMLMSAGVLRLYLQGLATDYCVLATALDTVAQGIETFVVLDAIAAVDWEQGTQALNRMYAAGVKARMTNRLFIGE